MTQRPRILFLLAALPLMAALLHAQLVSSHAPKAAAPAASSSASASLPEAAKPVVRVNGAPLTDRDLVRMMYKIFPYGQLHNGIPKSMEPEMRRGAMDMIVFEELVYQEALRRKMTVTAEQMKRAEVAFRRQFATEAEFNSVLQAEVHGSRPLMREKIRRSLLIEALLKAEVSDKSHVTEAEALAFYRKNPAKFTHPEMFQIQTISILPPANGNPDVVKEARSRAQEALTKARQTKSHDEFGRLAEQYSDDDFHVKMGDHPATERAQLPPEVVKAALKMKPGEVSELLQFDGAYLVFRLGSHVGAGKTPFEQAKKQLMKDMQKTKYETLRAALGKRLRKSAKIEEL